MAAQRWSKETAWTWHDRQGWVLGANFLPSTASNQLEMWQQNDWERQEATIQKELQWASQLGYNAMRVFMHDLIFRNEDKEAFLNRLERFLEISSSKKIRILLVFFDGCWDPNPIYGIQEEPRPFIHNSRWVQSPGRAILENPANYTSELKPYVQSVLRRFGNDTRILLFDLFNEPDQPNQNSYGYSELARVAAASDVEETDLEPDDKIKFSVALLNETFAWARQVGPLTTPLTVALWGGVSEELQELVLQNVDVVSFHNYENLISMKQYSQDLLSTHGRPVVCSEYMARPENSTFDPILGYLKSESIFAFNWGFVNGRSQTIYPWDSWTTQYNETSLGLWFHDVLRKDGSPYNQTEYEYIRTMAKTGIDWESFSQPAMWWMVVPIAVLILVLLLVVKVIRRRRDRRESPSAETEEEQLNDLELI